MQHARIAAEVFNRPHMIEPGYGRTFVSALSRHGFNIRSLADAEGVQYDAAQMEALSRSFTRGDRKLFDEVDGIAIIPIEGTLAHRYGSLNPSSGMTGYDGIQAKLEAALDDPDVRGIVLDINSPGGAVAGCFDLADQIYEARQAKPIWAVCDELACSAAYALASAATKIVAPRTAQIGSIGVLTMHVDQSQMVADMGLDVTFIHAGAHKVDGNAFEPLPDNVRDSMQADINQVYEMFTALVGRNRPGMSQQDAANTEARVYGADNALAAGLIDEIMPTHKALDAFQRELAPRGPFQSLQRGAKAMALPLFGRKKAHLQASSDQATHAEDTPAKLAEMRNRMNAADDQSRGAYINNLGGVSVAAAAVALMVEAGHDIDALAVDDMAASFGEDADDVRALLAEMPAAETAADSGPAGAANQAPRIDLDKELAAINAAEQRGRMSSAEANHQRVENAKRRSANEAASLDALVTLCGEHKLDALAKPLHDRGVTAEQADAVMADVAAIRDKMAATFPEDPQTAAAMADKFAQAAHSQSTPQFADALGALMVEACAVMSGDEIDHHPPADNGQSASRGSMNVAARYKR